ncbi:MAG: hypothetical protein KDC44_09120, partial [Phaeodactylibacter sp.]|nr:hypothetical protein [Phaeodactylibacter sp.]
MEKERQHELFEKYLAGSLETADQADFEVLKKEPGFEEALRLHQQLEATLGNEKLHHFRTQLQAADQDWGQHKQPTKVRRLTTGWRIGIAASVLILLSLSIYRLGPFSSATLDALFALNFEPYQMVLNQRSETDAPPLQLEAITAYQNAQYEQAAAAFEQLATSAPEQELYRFYAALSNLAADKPALARSTLEALSQTASDSLRQ